MDDHRNSGDEERPDEQTAHREHGGDDATHDRGSIGPGSEEPEPRVEQTLLEEEADAAEAEERGAHPEEAHGHGRSGQGHRGMHAGHEEMFRRRFLVSTLLSIPVLLYSETLQEWLGFTVPTFPGSEWINPVFATVVFAYGGVPFLRMALPEVRNRSPGMMTLISMAITVAFVYSLVGVVYPTTSAFFWELVTLVDIMLLGHWIEMRSVRQASSALDELAQLIPDTAERTTDTGDIGEVPVSELEEDDLVLVRPGANVPADGVVAIGSGTDVAVQSADLILVQNNPLAVVRLVRLSKASYRKMQENLVWAAGYNVVAIPLAAGVLAPVGILLSPAVGALLMSLSTVIVAINAQFLRRVDLDLPSLPDAAPSGSPRPADQADTSPRLRTGRQFMTEYGLLEGTERFRCPVKIDAIRFC